MASHLELFFKECKPQQSHDSRMPDFFINQMFHNPQLCSNALESLISKHVCPWREWINIKWCLFPLYTFLRWSSCSVVYFSEVHSSHFIPRSQTSVSGELQRHISLGKGTRPKCIMPAPSLIVASGFNLHPFGWRDILILSAALWELDCNLLRGLSRTRH